MNNMNAKSLFQNAENNRISEDGELPPEQRPQRPARPGGPRRPMRIPGGGGPEDDVARLTGGPDAGGPPAQFSPKEISQLKDVMIAILAGMLGSDLDKQIGQALMSGTPLEPGQLQHIIDEARRAEIPESHGPLMQKIFGLTGN